jgi:hypothetical protein
VVDGAMAHPDHGGVKAGKEVLALWRAVEASV